MGKLLKQDEINKIRLEHDEITVEQAFNRKNWIRFDRQRKIKNSEVIVLLTNSMTHIVYIR